MNSSKFEISNFNEYKEDNRLEVKKAKGGLPQSFFETYCAFANSQGGVILLGVEEKKDGSRHTSGLKKSDIRKLIKEFWDIINNGKKVSANLLKERDVKIYDINNDVILVIYVLVASRQDKPVFLNNDLFNGTFKRNFEGDYRCSREQVKAMLREQTQNTMDMEILENIPYEYLNMESVKAYRNRHRLAKDGHPFVRLSDEEFLKSIGAVEISKEDGKYHPTCAGLLMFGDEYNIIKQYPNYFLDYREMLAPTIRWTDRLQSSSGDWSGNIFDFYFRVYNKIIKEVKVHFKIVGGTRIDDTPIHKALREALANCLINADYYEAQSVVIKLEDHKLEIENAGDIRVGKKHVLLGGRSDPRNRGLMKMFNLIDIGEHAGSGVQEIFNTWIDAGLEKPLIKESFNPDRTTLVLSFDKTSDKKQAIKISDKNKLDKVRVHEDNIIKYLSTVECAKTIDVANKIGLSIARTRNILANMKELEALGSNKNRVYKLRKNIKKK